MVFLRLIVLSIFLSMQAYADISGETLLLVQNSQRSVAGNHVQGGWTEAFVDFAQFAVGLYQFLDGNPYAGYQAYQEFRQFLDASGDKAALSHGNVVLTQGAQPNARLRFIVRSDDDAFGILNVAYPNSGSIGAAFNRQISWNVSEWNGSKNATVDLFIEHNKLPVGNYPVVFYTKEKDCNMCLSITHKINVRVLPGAAMCTPIFQRPCALANTALLNTESAIEVAQREKRDAINGLYQNGPHEAMTQLERRLNVCRHVANPSECVDRAYREFEGFCARNAFGVRARDATCSRLNAIDTRLEQLERTRQEQVKARTNACVCAPPGGGPGGRPPN